MKQIPEQGWKRLRKLQDQLLQNTCDKILDRAKIVIDKRKNDSHKTYLNLWKTLKKEDSKLSMMFDDLKRSTAFFKLASWEKFGILSDEDLIQFSEETRAIVYIINSN